VVVGRLVGGAVAGVDVGAAASVTALVGGAGAAGADDALVATSMASALTARTEAARASVRGTLSMARTGSATAVSQTANKKRRRGTT
jgi:hypothetical protein